LAAFVILGYKSTSNKQTHQEFWKR